MQTKRESQKLGVHLFYIKGSFEVLTTTANCEKYFCRISGILAEIETGP